MRAIVAVLVVVAVVGCRRNYPQDSAQAVIDSAREMVAKGKAERLPDLIYADTPQMRSLLDEFGTLLGSLQDLAEAVHEAYPDEIADMRQDAIKAAERGEADDALARIFTGGMRGRRNGNVDPGDLINSIALTLLVDPYAFLAKNEQRLTSVEIADDMAALQWDGKPVFGPMVGLSMKQTEGKWQIMLPTHIGPVPDILANKEMCQMLGDFIVTLDNTIDDVRADVESGEARTLEEAASRTGEYAAVPAMLVFLAIGKYQEAVQDEMRAAREAETTEDG